MHLSDIEKKKKGDESTSMSPKHSEQKEREIVENSLDRYFRQYPFKLHHPEWPFKIEEVNSIKFEELEKWKKSWRFKAHAKVKQTDDCGIVHVIQHLFLAGNSIIDWELKTNPISPADKDWLPEIREVTITKLGSTK